MAAWYCGSVEWTAVTPWAALTAYSIGDLRRQLAAPAVGSERVWRVTTAGTSLAAEPTWTTTKGSTTTEVAGPVWTEVTGDSTYNWTAPHARLVNAFAWATAGDDVYLSEDHAETQASLMTCTSPGTEASPCRIICVNHSGTVPPVSTDLRTTATISTTGNSTLTLSGTAYYEGITFTASATTGTANLVVCQTSNRGMTLKNCKLALGGNVTTNRLFFGGSAGQGNYVRLFNTTLSFAAVEQGVSIRSRFVWENTASAILGTVPTTLFVFVSAMGGSVTLNGVDLSASGAGVNLFDISVAGLSVRADLTDCKLGSSVTICTGTPSGLGYCVVRLVNCDSADTNYRYYKESYEGSISQETTIIRSGGATNGTTPISFKMISLANTRFYSPLYSHWMLFWNNSAGSKTVTIPVLTDNVTLKDTEAWVEVEYLGTSGFPLGLFSSDAAADVLNAGANQTTDATSTWISAPGTPVQQSLSTTFTTTSKGIYRARVCLAKASTTMYFDPLIASGARQYMVDESGYLNSELAGGGGGGSSGIGRWLRRIR